MNVAELIKQLQDMPQDAPVYVYADRGQAVLKCDGVDLEKVRNGEAGTRWIEDPMHPDDIDPEGEYEQVVTIFNQ